MPNDCMTSSMAGYLDIGGVLLGHAPGRLHGGEQATGVVEYTVMAPDVQAGVGLLECVGGGEGRGGEGRGGREEGGREGGEGREYLSS